MKNIVIQSCNNTYVPKAIVAFTQFCSYNNNYKQVIIGTRITDEMKKLCESYNVEIIEVDLSEDFKNFEVVINDILSCEKTISSSLHGLIVSDAYSIPNKWIQFNNEINGDDTKFFDYFESVSRKDRTPIDCMNYKKIPENTFNLIESVSINFDIDFLEKKFFIDKNGIRNYTKYLYQKYCIYNL